MTIDPGTVGIGVAYWFTECRIPGICNSCFPLQSAFSLESNNPNWESRLNLYLAQLKCFYNGLKNLNATFIERPRFMQSHKGQTAAESDSLFKLIFAYGRIWQICTQFGKVYALPVNEWKGQLDKAKVIARIKRKIGMDFKSHDADAVGMGLHLLGIF